MNESTQSLPGDPVSIWSVIFRYSLILGLLYGGYSVLLYATGLVVNNATGLVSVVLYIVLLILAMRSFRSRNAGYMSFGQGFLIGFLVSNLSNIIACVMSYIYLAFIDDSSLDLMTQAVVDAMSANPGMNSETLEMMTGLFETIYSPGGLLIFGICMGIFLALFAALILTLFLKKSPPIA